MDGKAFGLRTHRDATTALLAQDGYEWARAEGLANDALRLTRGLLSVAYAVSASNSELEPESFGVVVSAGEELEELLAYVVGYLDEGPGNPNPARDGRRARQATR